MHSANRNTSTKLSGTVSAMTVLAAALVLAGCHGMRTTPERLAVRGERAVVRVAGHGSVTSEPAGIQCGPDAESDARCNAVWLDVGTPTLTATPAPGWAFERWEWTATNVSLSSGVTPTHQYRAVFRPVLTTVASNP
jgi:hypothetical protein